MMINTIVKNRSLIILFSVIVIGAFLRFYNLNWGQPFYFHPDERNIASSVSQLKFPYQMNPNFFAYGSFPIYLIHFTVTIVNFFSKAQDIFVQSIIISRFYSATLSLLIIPSIYFIGKKLWNRKIGLLSAVSSTLSVGFIQFAHFGTFEMWLTFLGLWLFYFSYQLVKNLDLRNILIIGIIFGILMATKTSSLPLIAFPFLSILLNYLLKKKSLLITLKTAIKCFVLIFSSFVVFASFSPYLFLDFDSFRNSMNYESSVALGTLPVFYTGEFFDTIPVVFQFIKVYPFLINPVLTVIFIPSFIYIFFKWVKTKDSKYLILNVAYLALFLSQAFLFAKWTRYIVPTLPFIYLITAVGFFDFIKFLDNKKHTLFNYQYTSISLVLIVSIIFSFSYLITVFLKQDTRVEASIWAKNNILPTSQVLSEVYDMGIVPFNQYLNSITLFNFYDLDQIPQIKPLELNEDLEKSEYLILPSPRILKTRLLNQEKFPYGYEFYNELINENFGYQKIYETECDMFCKISYLGDPAYSLEGTTNVFDRPTVFIFKNTNYR